MYYKRIYPGRLLLAFGAIVLLVLSVEALAQGTSSVISSANATTCQNLGIGNVKASGNDGNVPSNVIDDNLSTRWSNYGIGSWITADIGSQKTICSVDLAWYKGDIRISNFVISVSNDGTSFTNVYSGKSSGTTLSFEHYNFAETQARFVRITVNGNSMNNWASITEMHTSGYSTTDSTASKDPISIGNSKSDQFDSFILAASSKYNIDPMIIKSQIAQEGGFDGVQHASSDTPCGIPGVDFPWKVTWTSYQSRSFGLMQITPACSVKYSAVNPSALLPSGYPNLTTDPNSPDWNYSAFNPTYNIQKGTYDDRRSTDIQTKRFPDCTNNEHVMMGVGAYNAGTNSIGGCNFSDWNSRAQLYFQEIFHYWYRDRFAPAAGLPYPYPF
jgi:F5/8 type C domain-containing protein